MEKQVKTTFNLKHFVSVASQLAFVACEIAKDMSQKIDLKTYSKGPNDPVTEADFKIQTMLIKSFHHFFGDLAIVGEESTEFQGKIDIDLNKIEKNNCPIELDEAAALCDFCVWIDPIDNTKGFLNGDLHAVTILIGLSKKGVAEIGIIGSPFLKQNNVNVYHPQVFVGSVSAKTAFSNSKNSKWIPLERPIAKNPFKMVISNSRGKNNETLAVISGLNALLQEAGGSGYKQLMVIRGESDGMIYLKSANCKWDSCAGDAIIKAMGGFYSDQAGKDLLYKIEDTSRTNRYGNLAFFDPKAYQYTLDIVQQHRQKL